MEPTTCISLKLYNMIYLYFDMNLFKIKND